MTNCGPWLVANWLEIQHGTSSLVHEAYLRLLGKRDNEWPNRRYFFAAAGKAMWRIRCEWARLRKGPRQKEPLHSGAAAVEYDLAELLAIGEALEKLERIEARKADVVRLRYYCGLSVDETAEALGVSPRTVDSDWHFARSWLHRELKHGDTAPGAGGKARDDGQGPMGQNPRSLQAGAEPDA